MILLGEDSNPRGILSGTAGKFKFQNEEDDRRGKGGDFKMEIER